MNPSAQISLRVLGGFALERDAQPCELAYEKGRALLAYLAAEPGRSRSRASLAAMFWPDLLREAALTNLRQVLHNLRHVLDAAGLAAPVLQVNRESIRLDPAAGLEIDTAVFSTFAPVCIPAPCPTYCNPCLARMENLAGRYRGEYLAGFSLPECPDFEEWLQVQREALHLHALTLLARLADCHEQLGAYAKALSFALRFLELESWNEDALRRAMRLFALNGQRADALAQYEICCRALKRELGVLPSEETRALAERIRRGELAPPATDVPAVVATPLPVAQRRQLTVLYCELAPIGVEDPDEALALLRAPQIRCNEIIRNYSGYLVQVHGGSLLAYFGYPQASEDAVRLAVLAALAVARAAFSGLEMRIGAHTGMVIDGGDPQAPDAVGATSGLAIRLCQLATPGAVTISGATQRLVAGYFECLSLEPLQLPGSARPLAVFTVERESGAKCRLEAASSLTPLVGRQDEIAALLALWQDAQSGARRGVLLRGEAGIGKSRLVRALKGALRAPAYAVRELRCFPEHRQSPFYPLAVLFGSASAFPPQQQREKVLALALDRLYALAAQQPVLLVVEDLHWADPSTLELLKLFVTREHPAPILAVFTARPEFQPPWQEGQTRTLTLNALDDAQTAALIAAVAPEIAPATVRRIVERADGVPLFAEELAREVVANDSPAIPATLQDLLAARLDSLGAAKIVAQAAAAIGREFSFDVLRHTVRFDAATLAQSLRQLQDAGLLWGELWSELWNDTGGVLRFRHALIRDAAYQSQTRVEREATHRRIAIALKASATQTRPELLAQHWAAGGETREAVACWSAAGKLASQHSASEEAVAHFKSGLALLETLPADAERLRLELDLQIGLGAAACAAQGYASAQGATAYARAMALCGQHESSPDLFPAVWGLWTSASSRSGYAGALELAQQLRRMAGDGSVQSNPVHVQQSHFALANTLYWQGEFAAAREHLERVSTLYQPAHHEHHVAGFGEDAGVTSGVYLSWVLWFLGFPEQSRQASTQTLALARRLGHPYSLAYALTFAALLHCRLRRPEAALILAQETLDLANHHGFPLWQIGATLAHGWALAMQKQPESVASLQHCVAATRAAMGGVTLAVLEPLADACVVLGRFDDALNVHDQALAVGNALGDHHIEAELHRLKGEALLGLVDADANAGEAQAAACFQQALALSRRQQAKSLELRAATSLTRLWQKQGKRDDARRLLEETYGWFSEGFDTPDLQDARKLLDSLIS